MNKTPLVIIVLLNWNSWRDTIECLKSVNSLSYGNFEIIIVDNASTDDSLEKLSLFYPDLNIILSQANLGFGGGNNLGINYAISRKADYIWLLNNDTVVSHDSLKELVLLAETDENIGAVGSLILDLAFPYEIQAWGGGRVSFMMGRTWHLKMPGKIDYLTAASMLVRTEAIKKAKSFNEAFFMYWEDVDLSLRIRNEGYRIAVADKSQVYHKESSTLGKKNPLMDAYYNHSAVIFFRIHSKISVLPILVGFLSRLCKRIYEMDVKRIKSTIKHTSLAIVNRNKRIQVN